MKVGDRLVHLLIQYGVKFVFGVPGGQTMQLYRGIMQSGGRIQHVLMRDERSAGFAADAYARITGSTGICDATVGPGATNLISPLAEAYTASIPVIAIISDIPRFWEHRRVRGNASQALSQVELFRTISKWQVTITDPKALDNIVDTAFRVANTGRPGPVVLSIPDDVFTSPVSEEEPQSRIRSASFPWYRTAPDPKIVEKAIKLIYKKKKPALLVGGGTLISGAYNEVRILAEKLGAPIATTITGKGIIGDAHPLSIGVAGSMGRTIVNEILKEADLIIFVGTKTGQLATFGWDIPKADVSSIHIDIDPEEIGRNYPDSIPLWADAQLALAALIEALGNIRPQTSWKQEDLSNRVREWYREAVNKPQLKDEPLKPQMVMDIVNRFVTEEDIIVCDASLASGWAAVYCKVAKAGRQYLAPRGLAGLGWGAPAAIGTAIATGGKKRILHFAGDGGFGYSVQELEVMVRFNLPVVSILFNNDTLAWMKHVEMTRFKDGYISVDFNHVDFAAVAKGFGTRGYTVRTTDDLTRALELEQFPEGPAVIDMITDQWETPVLRFSSGA